MRKYDFIRNYSLSHLYEQTVNEFKTFLEVILMKKNIKKILAAISAVSVIAFGGISASAATADDVIGAARAAGFLEVYVVQLENFLLANKYTSGQYDTLVGAFANIESYGDEVALRYFGKTLAEMRGEGESDSTGNTSGGGSTGSGSTSGGGISKSASDSWAAKVADKMTNEDMLKSLDEIIASGKELGLDVTVEQTGDKSFNVTVKDKDGKIQLIAPIGKIVSKTGVEAETTENNFASVAAICASIMAAGGIGAWLINRKNAKIGE